MLNPVFRFHDLSFIFFQCGFVLQTHLRQQFYSLCGSALKLLFPQQFHPRRAGIILHADNAVQILPDTLAEPVVLLSLSLHRYFQPLLQSLVKPCAENLPENSSALLGSRQKKLLKISLRNHRNLRKLLSVKSDQFCDGARHLL